MALSPSKDGSQKFAISEAALRVSPDERMQGLRNKGEYLDKSGAVDDRLSDEVLAAAEKFGSEIFENPDDEKFAEVVAPTLFVDDPAIFVRSYAWAAHADYRPPGEKTWGSHPGGAD